MGNNPINSLLKGLKAENRVANPGSKGDRYPTSIDQLNLCGLPLPAQYQAEENQCLKQQLNLQAEVIHSLKEKLDHLINVQVQTSHQLKVLQDVISQVPGAKPSVTLTVPEPSIDDRQSIDNLLADDEGQEMEQDEPETQQAEQNGVQMLDGTGVQLSPEDEVLRIAVNSIIVDGEEQNQKQEQ